ncbi:MAG: protein jag [Clostridia bacterium]|nr:protein jag [Clostridia bacterium]
MQYTGKTVEEAKALALNELGITEEKAVITVVEEPTKGLFGRLKGKAVIEVEVKKEEKTAGATENTLKFVQGVLSIMGYDVTAELTEGKETTITLKGADASAIIGHRGEILDAIQTLAGAAENIGRKEYKKVVVDCENYRDKREDTLVKLAHKLEEKATEMRREVILEPMSPYERRIIHTALADSTTVTTKSDGREPNRYVVIVPNDKDEFSKPYNAGRNERGRKDDRRGGRGRNDRRGGKGGKRQSGFIERPKKSSSFSFGTYLGNSLKDKE